MSRATKEFLDLIAARDHYDYARRALERAVWEALEKNDPQPGEEVIRLREEIDRLKWYCLDGRRSAEAEEAHATGERRARAQGKQEAYYSIYLQITQEQHKEN